MDHVYWDGKIRLNAVENERKCLEFSFNLSFFFSLPIGFFHRPVKVCLLRKSKMKESRHKKDTQNKETTFERL